MRRLSFREKLLLAILLVLVVVSGYILFFYTPMNDRLTELDGQIADTEDQILAYQIKAEQQRRMEKELEELFAADPDPAGLAPYDNVQAVMFELNSILAQTKEYSLDFNTVDASQAIVRRPISLRYTVEDYETAKTILKELHDSKYRCMLDSVSVSLGGKEEQELIVSATIVFFEYTGDLAGGAGDEDEASREAAAEISAAE